MSKTNGAKSNTAALSKKNSEWTAEIVPSGDPMAQNG
jgi:hypothetical protein